MKCIISGLLKSIITVYCCLCITIINCDNESNEKRSVIGTDVESPNTRNFMQLESARDLINLDASNSKLKNSNVPENQIAVNTVSQNNTQPGTNDLTSKPVDSNNSTKINVDKNVNVSSVVTKKPGVSPNMQPPLNTGALLRGASVFLGLSIVVIAYIIFRCARLNKNQTQMVRKYGILAHRQDVEMRPLPLNDEDEDDTTVFDASEIGAIHDKQRRTT